MDIFLVIGMIGGLIVIVTGLLMKGATVSILISPEAFLVILAGTAIAIMNSYPPKEFANIPKLFKVLFSNKAGDDPVEVIKELVEMAQETRKNGLLALESRTQNMENKFMKKGLEMVVDGMEPEYVAEVLNTEIESMEERHKVGAQVFATAGGTAPTLGVMGAVIGLMGALGDISDTEKLCESIAGAFVATLYGIFTGYVIWHPFSSRLKRKSAEEISTMYIMLEGILAIQSGKNPKSIELKLTGMLDPKKRASLELEDGEK
ncbi:flagellar motor stator protein MotA [Clostridium oryzae]|uniref:Chemotaxis protein PomA n=1 Tax=Clostridium oryzae TaxID=1450648 RepID=A0A1V4ITY3_9CLOT|nr:flagellar motor stator protein MotA [Clostridium oryzae]OPJ62917.1 chemotaxis protein PomA [Clostridium oryzae]